MTFFVDDINSISDVDMVNLTYHQMNLIILALGLYFKGFRRRLLLYARVDCC